MINKTSVLRGKIFLPASKSYTIRAFMVAACGGSSIIMHPSDCADAQAALAVAQRLGAVIKRRASDQLAIQAPRIPQKFSRIQVQESGTVLRFLLPLLCLRGKAVTVEGRGTLRGRPNLYLIRALAAMGMRIQGTGAGASVPVRILGGALTGGRVKCDASLSSQFISGLLITCPQLAQDTRLSLTGKSVVSFEYITMTRLVLAEAGVIITQDGPRDFLIKGGQKFRGLKRFAVPSDYGLAAFLLAAAALTQSDVILEGHFADRWIQADGRILEFFKKMGARFTSTGRSLRIKGPFAISGGEFSLQDCPDLVPIMTVLALFGRGPTRLRHIGHARVKESDRISDLRRELLKVGADISEKKDELVITPKHQYKEGCLLDPHQDHRLAMAFAILGLKLGVRIKDRDCVNKSYPGFWEDLRELGGNLKFYS
ncbi:MAG: 3-phosphoshikimate 1-carboxyvinyltransferase [Candidatus Omnitrophica bacterium]|nr:3-phosphoshikimate 1-carboxyvinyltransferase [Candidatus Omnitrophota bacterium]